MKVHGSRMTGRESTLPYGTVTGVDGEICVACGDGAVLSLLCIQAEGGKRMVPLTICAATRSRRGRDWESNPIFI